MGQVNASALAASLRLDYKGLDESSLPGLREIMINLSGVIGIEKGPWVIVIILRKFLLHLGQSKRKCILPRDDTHRRKMIDPLRIIHPLQGLIDHPSVTPLELPVLGLPEVLHLPVQRITATHLLQNRVFGI